MAKYLTDAETVLFKQHYDDVYRATYMYCKDKHQTEDAVQEAFLIAFKKIRQLKEPKKFPAWVTTIAINQFKNNYNRDKSIYTVSLEEHDFQVPHNEIYTNIETKEDLEKLLLSLDENKRQVLILHYYFDISISEITEMLQVKEGTVKSRLYYAREKLRKLFLADQKKSMEVRND